MTLPTVEGNPFLLQFFGNKSESQSGVVPNIFLPTVNQSSYTTMFSNGNPFFNFGPGSNTDVIPFNASGFFASAPFVSITQAPYRPLSYYTPAPLTPEPPQRPFTEEVRPPSTPSLLDLIPHKIGGGRKTRSELSE